MKKKLDVSETLMAEADALGPELVFDRHGKRVEPAPDDRPAKVPPPPAPRRRAQ